MLPKGCEPGHLPVSRRGLCPRGGPRPAVVSATSTVARALGRRNQCGCPSAPDRSPRKACGCPSALDRRPSAGLHLHFCACRRPSAGLHLHFCACRRPSAGLHLHFCARQKTVRRAAPTLLRSTEDRPQGCTYTSAPAEDRPQGCTYTSALDRRPSAGLHLHFCARQKTIRRAAPTLLRLQKTVRRAAPTPLRSTAEAPRSRCAGSGLDLVVHPRHVQAHSDRGR
jgi:hypothetical protein